MLRLRAFLWPVIIAMRITCSAVSFAILPAGFFMPETALDAKHGSVAIALQLVTILVRIVATQLNRIITINIGSMKCSEVGDTE